MYADYPRQFYDRRAGDGNDPPAYDMDFPGLLPFWSFSTHFGFLGIHFFRRNNDGMLCRLHDGFFQLDGRHFG